MSDVEYIDKGWAAILSSVAKAGSTEVRVGIVGEAATREHPDSRGLTVAEVAMVNEYGTSDGHVPERAAIRETFQRNRGLVKDMLASAARAVLQGAEAAPQLALAGERMAEELRRTIEAGVAPHNAPATVEKKGFDHPLVEDQAVLDAVGYELARRGAGGAGSGNVE